ncbi:MAG: carbamoyltransferase N-terminal domain-containing protein [Planctomycetota bacterium]|nr:carbamoyltransferase N-terminal domain-containing protein [Planctomycetota bacterium]
MTAILGISAFYHDSAAALVVDGQIVAAAQEERFTRRKHDAEFPLHAVNYCLDEARITAGEIDYVGFYEKPLLKFERLLETYLAYAPRGFRSFTKAVPLWLQQKLHLPREIRAGLNGAYRKRIVFTEHHQSHAASAFFPSPFSEAAIVTFDGVGEWATASVGVGQGNEIRLLEELRFPHSLGLLYSAFTYYCGFRVNSGEYKLMGLAPYGEPQYVDLILDHLLDLKDDGSFRLDMSYFNYCQGLTMTSEKFHRLFAKPARTPEAVMDQEYMDIAASIQKVTEIIMLQMVSHAHHLTGKKNLCLAGGGALNCVGNGKILHEGPFDQIWIQPAAGDAGGALGVAQFIWHQLLENDRTVEDRDSQGGSLLGPQYIGDDVRQFLDSKDIVYQYYDEESELCERVAVMLDNQQVVGWMQGRMEFGPRALGNRSILGDARSPDMQANINLKIKFRESFRPFAPAVLEDHCGDYFDLAGDRSPYMLLVAPVAQGQRRELTADEQAVQGVERRSLVRSTVPAITHVDYSARVQTIDENVNPRFHHLVERYYHHSQSPLVVNTSFNIRGEPIVCTPEDAYRCFMATNMDVLVMDRFVVVKQDQNEVPTHEMDQYLGQFPLD